MAKPKSLPYEAPETAESYSVTLHNTSGGADKIYKLAIEPEGDLWSVKYANGRRGSTLQTGLVTKGPVPYAEARKQCNSKLFAKVGDGYVPIDGSRFGDGMTAEAIATIAKESSGVVPQLLNPIDDTTLEAVIRDDNWVGQLKFDGERRILISKDGNVTGGNRKGQTVPLSAPIASAAKKAGGQFVLDGEQVGDVFYFWDVLELDGNDYRAMPLDFRLALMDKVGIPADEAAIVPVRTAIGTEAKRQLLEYARANGEEGIVFKRLDARYEPGKPGSKATWVKFKLWQSLSAVVGKVNDQRSVGLHLLDNGQPISVGNVTIPANHAVPVEGEVVEIRYLYAYEGGSLFQPTYLGKRNDIVAEECVASQRVFKASVDAAPASLAM